MQSGLLERLIFRVRQACENRNVAGEVFLHARRRVRRVMAGFEKQRSFNGLRGQRVIDIQLIDMVEFCRYWPHAYGRHYNYPMKEVHLMNK